MLITREHLETWLRQHDSSLKQASIQSILYAKDKMNVPSAMKLLRALLAQCTESASVIRNAGSSVQGAGDMEQRRWHAGLAMLGTAIGPFVMMALPGIETPWSSNSIMGQLMLLSASAHALAALFRENSVAFIPAVLYHDLIANVTGYFMAVVRAMQLSEAWEGARVPLALALLGTDQQEEMHATLRAAADVNFDMLQLQHRLPRVVRLQRAYQRNPTWRPKDKRRDASAVDGQRLRFRQVEAALFADDSHVTCSNLATGGGDVASAWRSGCASAASLLRHCAPYMGVCASSAAPITGNLADFWGGTSLLRNSRGGIVGTSITAGGGDADENSDADVNVHNDGNVDNDGEGDDNDYSESDADSNGSAAADPEGRPSTSSPLSEVVDADCLPTLEEALAEEYDNVPQFTTTRAGRRIALQTAVRTVLRPTWRCPLPKPLPWCLS